MVDSTRISGCSIQKQSRIITIENEKGNENERTDNENGSENGSVTESVSADRGSVSENGSERGTRSDSGGKKSGREREPNEMRRTGNTETVTETKTGRRTRKSQNPGPHSHQAVKLSHQRKRPPL